jgi:hypothetical protein
MYERLSAGDAGEGGAVPAKRCGATFEAIIRSFPGRVLTVTVLCARKRPLSFDSCAPAPAAKRARGGDAAAAAPVRLLFSAATPPLRGVGEHRGPRGVFRAACCRQLRLVSPAAGRAARVCSRLTLVLRCVCRAQGPPIIIMGREATTRSLWSARG